MSGDYQAWADTTAYEMRDYYEANRPLHWWQTRNPPGSWGILSDELMLGLMNVVLNSRLQFAPELAIYEEALRKIAGGCCHPARREYHNNVSMAMIAKDALGAAIARRVV